ncbi:MAG: signal peptidase I [Kiritimatiellae bacterium]|nr:signal peptidase I [Kiritimatiellia bacterium]
MSPEFLYAALTVGSAVFALWCLWSLCWGVVPFTAKAKARKERKTVLNAARTFLLSYEDLPAYRDGGECGARMGNLRDALARKDVEGCKSLLEFLDAPKSCAAGREWLDILVVSISVAMAFRAYFYEPFNIPTGSMQPTLYGNHSEPCSPVQATAVDKSPLRWCKWLLTGRMYECFEAPFGGSLQFRPTQTGHYDMRVVNGATGQVSRQMLVPTDVLHPTETGDGPYRQTSFQLPNGLRPGSPVRAGQLLWSGYVATGDFLFVNRWLWNFRHPRRGDVMIFSTTGIHPREDDRQHLQQGTHYIKRMTGTPNETLAIRNGRLQVDGAEPMEPRRIAQIQRREKWHEKAYPYAGYRVSERPDFDFPGSTLAREGDTVKLGPAEYYACGDNSPSSYDSRYWGPVPAANLRGIAGGVFWPFTHRWGPIE